MSSVTTLNELVAKSLAGIDYIDIAEIEGGIKVRRRKLSNDLVMNHVYWLMEQALRDVVELQYEQNYNMDFEKPKTVNEYIQFLKKGKSDFVLESCVENDRIARIISLIQEALAIIRYVVGDYEFNKWVENY